jgi:RNA polymerase sigma factor (sigma-70 family)
VIRPVTKPTPAFTITMIKGSTYSDGELLAAIGSGDQLNNAIYFIYQQFSQTIQSFILANSGMPADAEDIFQETVVIFIDLVKKNKFRGEASVKTFLTAIARNLWLNELKKRERSEIREKAFEKNRDATEPDVSQHMANQEIKQQFLEVLGKLGENCKKLLTLCYYENMSMKDIVHHLPYENEQVVRNKKYKCLQSLTEMIKQNPVIARLVNKL